MSAISLESNSSPQGTFKDSTWQSFYAMPSLKHLVEAQQSVDTNHIAHGNPIKMDSEDNAVGYFPPTKHGTVFISYHGSLIYKML